MTRINQGEAAEPQHSRSGLQEPPFYYRQYENDVTKPEKPKTPFDQCKRVALVALPFIGLCKPFAKPLSLAMDGLRGISSLSSLVTGSQKGDSGQIASATINTAISAAAIAGTIFASPLGMLITTGHDLVLNSTHLVHALSKKDYKKAGEMGAQMVASSLYMGMFFTASLELSILASSAQILIGLYRSKDDFDKGNYLEAGGHALMAAIRTHQISPQIKAIQFKWEIQRALQKQPFYSAVVNKVGSNELEIGHIPKQNSGMIANKSQGIDPSFKATQSEMDELSIILAKYGNNPEGLPSLHYAIRQRDYRAVDVLLKFGASPLTRDVNNYSCLYHSILADDVILLKKFIGLGLNPNTLATHDLSYLSVAIMHHKNNAAKYLINSGVNLRVDGELSGVIPRPPNNPSTFIACSVGNYEMLKVLIDRGIGIDMLTGGYNSKLPYVVRLLFQRCEDERFNYEKIKCLELLIERNKITLLRDPDEYLYLISNGYPQGLAYLLDKGYISANQYSLHNESHILSCAIQNTRYRTELVNLLISRGADVKAIIIGSHRWTVLHFLAHLYIQTDREALEISNLIELCLKNGADINAIDLYGRTSLKLANDKQIIDVLKANGAH